jgi:hypothetical protein
MTDESPRYSLGRPGYESSEYTMADTFSEAIVR